MINRSEINNYYSRIKQLSLILYIQGERKMRKMNIHIKTISMILVGVMSLGLSAHGNKSTFQTANSTNQTSAGMLVITNQSVDARLALTGLDADAAYTVWWVVFNKPDNCMNGPGACGPGDVPNAKGSVFFATGFVTGNDGNANVTTHLKAGKPPKGLEALVPGGLKRGNAFKAEFHMVVRSHGSPIPGTLAEQIGTNGGGCDINACSDQFTIIFPPVMSH